MLGKSNILRKADVIVLIESLISLFHIPQRINPNTKMTIQAAIPHSLFEIFQPLYLLTSGKYRLLQDVLVIFLQPLIQHTDKLIMLIQQSQMTAVGKQVPLSAWNVVVNGLRNQWCT